MAGTTTDNRSVVRGPQQWFFYGVLAVFIVAAVFRFGWLLHLPLTNDETSALMRLRVLGAKEDLIQSLLAQFVPGIDLDILQGDGLDSTAFANNLKGLSI